MLEGLIMTKMPKVILPVILTLVLLVTSCSAGPEPPDGKSPTASVEGTQVGNLAPDFQLQNLDGQAVSLGNLRNKPVLINFWATWCPPCRSEMPYIQEIYEEWSGKGLVVLTINMGEKPPQVEEFLESQNLSLPVLLDTGKNVAQKYNVQFIPTTFFIDEDGVIQEKIIGAFPNKAAIEKSLSKIIP